MHKFTKLSKLTPAVTLLIFILEVPDSKFGRDTTFLIEFSWFSSVPPVLS
jgi:hypothetical protein